MNALSRIILSATATFAVGVHAGGSRIDLRTPDFSFLPDGPPETVSPSLWQRFETSFPERSDEVFTDKLHPFNLIQRDDEGHVRLFDDSLDRPGRIARGAFSDAVSSSLRDAALSLDLPIMTWLEEREDFFANLLWNSLDSVEEESISPLDPSYHRLEQSWWDEVSKSDRLHFGLRPMNTSPYAFVSWRIKTGDHVWLLANLRYRFRGFADHSFELALSMPMPRGLSLDFGTSYQMGQHEERKALVFKLTKYFSRNGLIHFGVEAQKQPVLIAGVSFSW